MVSTDLYPLLETPRKKNMKKRKVFPFIYRHTILFRMNKKIGFLYS